MARRNENHRFVLAAEFSVGVEVQSKRSGFAMVVWSPVDAGQIWYGEEVMRDLGLTHHGDVDEGVDIEHFEQVFAEATLAVDYVSAFSQSLKPSTFQGDLRILQSQFGNAGGEAGKVLINNMHWLQKNFSATV